MPSAERPAAVCSTSPAGASPARRWLRGVSTASWERVGVGLLLLGALAGFFVYPTYPNYDSVYSLLWGRELLAFDQLSFEAYRAPTEHPLAIAFGALLNPLGGAADRAMIAFSVLSFVVLVVAVYMLAKTAFTPLVGAIAAALVLTRFDFPFLAARGYIDISYLAVVMVAAVIEARAPRRHPVVVLGLLAAAGLMRPEAWLLAGLYWLWIVPPATWGQRAKYALLAAIGPVVWVGADFAVTGNPTYSLTATGELANELGRDKGIGEVPDALYTFLITLTKFPVFIAGIAGLLLAIVLTPRRSLMPFVLFASGVGTFAAVGLAGLSVIDRYLLVASLALMVFAAVFIGGWTMLREDSKLRRPWAVAGAAVVLFGIAFTVTRVDLGTLDTELRFRSQAHVALDEILHDRAVTAALRCEGANLYVPNHKLIPDVRWILDRPRSGVVARSAVQKGEPVLTPQRGVVLVVHDRLAIGRQALVTSLDRPEQNVPPPTFDRIATSSYYSAYARC
ncbi:MAG: hypothetical protein ACRDKY_03655 [Solirubrobacteraceae bacterium]